MIALSKAQIHNLLINCHSLIDHDFGELFYVSPKESFEDDDTFSVFAGHGGKMTFKYENAEFCNGSVTFETPSDHREAFEVLVVVTDGSRLVDQLLNTRNG